MRCIRGWIRKRRLVKRLYKAMGIQFELWMYYYLLYLERSQDDKGLMRLADMHGLSFVKHQKRWERVRSM